ncbi:MAG: prenyltransferase/squalene oxidase repeat-containing protein [Tepidiformaceae bacterium]
MKRLLLILVAAFVAVPLFAASAAIPESKAATKGAAFLFSVQNADGTYDANADKHASGQVMDSIFAVRAAGFDPNKDVLQGGKSPADYLKANAAAAVKPAAAAKAALGAKALGLDPKAVNGTNLIANIIAGLDAATGKYAADDFSQSIAMLGLACTGNTVAPNAAAALKATQLSDGGWGFGGASDADTTAIAIQALLASGTPKTDSAVVKAITYLKTTIQPDGGWGYAPVPSNASSTAFALQALFAAGEDVNVPQYIRPGPSPVSFLLSQQNADGSFMGFDPVFATNQALPALAGRTFCNAPETPITQTRPVAVPSPVPTASPTIPPTPAGTPPPAATKAPLPPSTGNSADASDTPAALPMILVVALLLSGGTLLLRRRVG